MDSVAAALRNKIIGDFPFFQDQIRYMILRIISKLSPPINKVTKRRAVLLYCHSGRKRLFCQLFSSSSELHDLISNMR